MILAVTYDQETGNIFPRLEEAKVLKVYEFIGGELVNSELVGTMAESVEDIIGLVMMLEADGILCGSLLEETRSLLQDEGIEYYSGFEGDADEAARDFIDGFVLLGPDD